MSEANHSSAIADLIALSRNRPTETPEGAAVAVVVAEIRAVAVELSQETSKLRAENGALRARVGELEAIVEQKRQDHAHTVAWLAEHPEVDTLLTLTSEEIKVLRLADSTDTHVGSGGVNRG